MPLQYMRYKLNLKAEDTTTHGPVVTRVKLELIENDLLRIEIE